MATYKLTMVRLVTEMLTGFQNILTDEETLDQADGKVGRALEMFNLAAQVYKALDTYSENS